MDQQQATNFILDRLKLGYSKIDIAADLSQRLGAPPDLIMRFVAKVSDTNNQQQPSFENKETPENDQQGIEPTPYSDNEWEQNADEALYASDPDLASPDDGPEIISEEFTPIESTQPDPLKVPPPKADVDLEELAEFVVQSLKRHQRFNDIVETVCQKTGISWNQAHRFVARTQTEHHKELTKSSRTIMTPLSIGFIVGGILLLIWSIGTMFDYYTAFTSQEYTTIPFEFIFLVGGAFVTSFAIITGGAYGLYKTLSSH